MTDMVEGCARGVQYLGDDAISWELTQSNFLSSDEVYIYYEDFESRNKNYGDIIS